MICSKTVREGQDTPCAASSLSRAAPDADDGREPPAAPDLRSQLRGGRARDAPAGTLLRTRVTDARVVGDLRAKLQPPRAPQPPSLPEFLAALGLERYAPLFEAEEVNMAALALCSDEDMRALGVPLGPRRLIRSMLPQ